MSTCKECYIYGHSSENLYDANLYTLSYTELKMNTILLVSGHNLYNRTIQVVPLLKKSMYGSPFSTILHRLFISTDKMMINIVIF
jgi:hypothetical protein